MVVSILFAPDWKERVLDDERRRILKIVVSKQRGERGFTMEPF